MHNYSTDVLKLAKKDDPKALAEFLKTIGTEHFADSLIDHEVSGDIFVGEEGDMITKELGMSTGDHLCINVLSPLVPKARASQKMDS